MAIQHQGIFFEQLGFRYYGPIDGHDLAGLLHHLKNIQQHALDRFSFMS